MSQKEQDGVNNDVKTKTASPQLSALNRIFNDSNVLRCRCFYISCTTDFQDFIF